MNKNILLSVILCSYFAGCGSNSTNTDETKTANTMQKNDISSLKKLNTEKLNIESLTFKEIQAKNEIVEKNHIKILNDKNIPKKTFKGVVFNSNIKNARVCLDFNNNNICDFLEPLTVTNNKGEFDLKVPLTKENEDKLNQNKVYTLLSSRGEDTDVARKFMAYLKAPLLNNEELTPIGTFLMQTFVEDDFEDKNLFISKLQNKKTLIANLFNIPQDDIFSHNSSYKQNLILQKTAQLLSQTHDNSSDMQSLQALKKTYEILAKKLNSSSDYENLLQNIDDEKLLLAKKSAINIAKSINKIDLENNIQRQSLVSLLDHDINLARDHFRNKSSEFILNEINENTLVDDALVARLVDIGLSKNVALTLLDEIKTNNLFIKDLDNLKKIQPIAKLKPLTQLLKQQANANSELFVLKSVIKNNTLSVFFSHEISKQSIEKLKNINNIHQIYTISGLLFEVVSTSYDEVKNVNILTLKDMKIIKSPQIYINKLALSDKYGVFTKDATYITQIETMRYLPKTHQEYVFVKNDDASINYGTNLNYQQAQGLISNISNLQFEDIEFKDNVNDNINKNEAVKYCQNATTYGYNDWRLPNVKEAVSATRIDGKDVFKYYPNLEVIHVETENQSLERTMGVDKFGQVATVIKKDDSFFDYKAEKYAARCVRDINSGSMFPNKAFDNIIVYEEDITSYDPTLNIMFSEEKYKETKDFDNNHDNYGNLEYAIDYCNNLNNKKYGGFSNWRLMSANDYFYSLDNKGQETFQNKLPSGYGYYITSSSSYIDNARLSWFVGNYYSRLYSSFIDKGFIRCVRDMNENTLNNTLDKNAPANKDIKRKYKVENNQVELNVSSRVFTINGGIRLSQKPDKTLPTTAYEISNMLDEKEKFPHYLIKSFKKNGVSINPIKQDVMSIDYEAGYFSIYLEREIAANAYGKLKVKKGDIIELIINNRLYDVKVILNITQ